MVQKCFISYLTQTNMGGMNLYYMNEVSSIIRPTIVIYKGLLGISHTLIFKKLL